MGSKRTESNTANVDISSNVQEKKETEQFILTNMTGVITVIEK